MPPEPVPDITDNNGRTMAELDRITEKERANQVVIGRAAKMWDKISGRDVGGTGALLPVVYSVLGQAANKVREKWRDPTHDTAFEEPVQKAQRDIAHAKDVTSQVTNFLKVVYDQIGTTLEKVPSLVGEYRAKEKEVAQYSEQLQSGFAENPEAIMFWRQRALNRMRELVIEAGGHVSNLAAQYKVAKAELENSTKDLRWSGGKAGDPGRPSPRATPTSPGTTKPKQSPGGGQKGGGQQGGGQQGGGQQGGGGEQGGGGGETGLSGGQGGGKPPTTPQPFPPKSPYPPYPTPPPPPLPGPVTPPPKGPPLPTPPGGGGLASGGGGGGAASGAGSPARQAARDLTTSPTGETGRAPGLAGTGATGAAARAGSPMGGGVPPMMPPMAPHGAAGDNGRPKPGTAPPTGTGRNRPAGGTAGVPTGLRGRTGKGDAGTESSMVSRRARRDGPQTVEILDSDLWRVDEPNPANKPNKPNNRPMSGS